MFDVKKLNNEKDEKMKEEIYLSKAEHTLSGKIRRLNDKVRRGGKIDIFYMGRLTNELRKVTPKLVEIRLEIRHMTFMQSQLKKELTRRRR